jgi:hypothetical protein
MSAEMTLKIKVVVTKTDYNPAEPAENIPRHYLTIEELEFYDGDELITDKALVDALENHVFERNIDKLNLLAENEDPRFDYNDVFMRR